MNRFRFVAAAAARFPSALLGRVLGVSRAGDYAWRHRRPSARARADGEVTRRIREIHAAGRATRRLMRMAGLAGCHRRRRRPRTTVPDRRALPAPDLVRRAFRPVAPDRLWVADVT